MLKPKADTAPISNLQYFKHHVISDSDIFSTSLGNVSSGGKVVVHITYVGELKHDGEFDAIRWTLPTSIAPRYGNGPDIVPQHGIAQMAGCIKIVVDVDVGPSPSSKVSNHHRILLRSLWARPRDF